MMFPALVAVGVALRFSEYWRTNAISAPMPLGVMQLLKWAARGVAGRTGTSGSLFPTIIRQSLIKSYLKRCRLCSGDFLCRPKNQRLPIESQSLLRLLRPYALPYHTKETVLYVPSFDCRCKQSLP